jgi:hypothetical protein
MARGSGVFRVGEGEEARLTPEGPTAAEIHSRGYLPFRVHASEVYRLRPAFPGTAVVIDDRAFEVVAEVEVAEDAVVYRLVPWPDSQVVRDRVVYGPRLVRAAQAERRRVAQRRRYRPFRFLLYPLVGLLPEAPQERLCDRLGLYSVTATLVSGLGEGLSVLALIWLSTQVAGPWRARLLGLAVPAVFLLVLPGLGRAFGALAFRETAGSALVILAWEATRALGRRFERPDDTVVPLTRQAFWARLALPDRVATEADGSILVRGLLPHLSWKAGTRLRAGEDYWLVTPLPPALERGRLVYSHQLTPLEEPVTERTPTPVPPTAYAQEVLAQVHREWDDLMGAGFSWLVSLLPTAVQKRAVERLGGPPAILRSTIVSALVAMALALYILQFLPRSPAADPLAPWFGALALALLVDGGVRLYRASQGGYAPSVLALVLPCDSLRPERLAYHAHRDAERRALGALQRS